MHLKNVKLNHDQELIHRVLGMTDYSRTISRERIFFYTINRSIQVHELFEDIEDAPAEMRTVTADLQTILQEIINPLEYEFTLMHFFNYHRIALEASGMYRAIKRNTQEDEDEEDEMDTLKKVILKAVMKMKERHDEQHGSHDDEDKEEPTQKIDQMNNSTMIKRVELVAKSNNNFDKYISLLTSWSDYGADTSFSDDIINNL